MTTEVFQPPETMLCLHWRDVNVRLKAYFNQSAVTIVHISCIVLIVGIVFTNKISKTYTLSLNNQAFHCYIQSVYFLIFIKISKTTMLISERKPPFVISVALIRYDCVAAVNWMFKEVYVLVFKLIALIQP